MWNHPEMRAMETLCHPPPTLALGPCSCRPLAGEMELGWLVSLGEVVLTDSPATPCAVEGVT